MLSDIALELLSVVIIMLPVFAIRSNLNKVLTGSSTNIKLNIRTYENLDMLATNAIVLIVFISIIYIDILIIINEYLKEYGTVEACYYEVVKEAVVVISYFRR